ncbi:MAG: NeuD/PglB/VioB family sugar acetyltransferase [Clostridium sp.]|uniref:NeuD/PglB/VioB family sugar acetyltransferase n=1 Tax=Clostridium sp. TaxID=1506 RepID=UPI00302BA16D
MKENIVIVGCGQHARVVLYNALEQDKYNVVGYIGECDGDIGKIIDNIPVIGMDDDMNELIVKYNLKGYILGLGGIKIRRKIIDKYSKFNIEPVSVIHPHAVIAPNAVIGKGTLIECGCLVTPNPIIGEHCVINTMTGVNHDNVLGNNVYLASGITLSGTVIIGEDTLVDDGVIITLGTTIGKGCIIGAGSVVTKNVEDNKVVYGVPGKVIRDNR